MQPRNDGSHEFKRLAPSAHVLESALEEEPVAMVDLAEIWNGLVDGSHCVASTLCTEERCFVALDRLASRSTPPPTQGCIAILERILLGESQKSIAFETNRAISTISDSAGRCLGRMSRESQVSHVSVLVVMALHAAKGHRLPQARVSRADHGVTGRSVISFPRPDLSLSERLSTAEYSVIRLLIEGRTHREIARLRRRSARTIANQLSSVFAKLGVSGRTELLIKLVREACAAERGRTSSVEYAKRVRAALGRPARDE